MRGISTDYAVIRLYRHDELSDIQTTTLFVNPHRTTEIIKCVLILLKRDATNRAHLFELR